MWKYTKRSHDKSEMTVEELLTDKYGNLFTKIFGTGQFYLDSFASDHEEPLVCDNREYNVKVKVKYWPLKTFYISSVADDFSKWFEKKGSLEKDLEIKVKTKCQSGYIYDVEVSEPLDI